MKTKGDRNTLSVLVLVLALLALASAARAQRPAPTATTTGPSDIETTSATLNGKANPEGWGYSAAWVFEWGTSGYTSWGPNGQLGNMFSPGVTSTEGVSYGISGLVPNTKYHYQLVVYDASGDFIYGGDESFTTLPVPPAVATGAASAVTAGSATLNSTVNPNGADSVAYFQWGLTAGYGNTTPPLDAGAAASAAPVESTLTGLSPNTTYYYQLVATNSGGVAYGEGQSFTTLPLPPGASTLPATPVTAGSATLNGTVNPNGADSVAYFQWGLTTAYQNTTPPQDAGSGSSVAPVQSTLTGLSPNTTYYYQLVATNRGGVAYGTGESFTTPLPPPVIRPPTSQAGMIILTWQAVPGQTYVVQYSTDLKTWTNLPGGSLSASGGITTLTVSDLIWPAQSRFYRVLLLQ